MKLRNIFSLFLVSVLCVFSSCDTLSHEEKQDPASGEEIRFILREDLIDLTSASIRVKHNGAPDLMWVYMQTSDLLTSADKLIEDRVSNEYEFTERIVARIGNNKSIHLDGLDAKMQYRIIVKAIDAEGKLYGRSTSLVFKTKRNPDVWEENDNWTITRKVERTESTVLGSNEIQEYENFVCTSKDQEPYIVLALTRADYLAYPKDDEHKDVKRTIFEDYYADFMASSENRSRILKGDGIWEEERLRSGDYIVFMIGLDEDNELSGLYKQFSISIAEEEPTETFNNWLGNWEVSFQDSEHDPWTVTVTSLDANMWCMSYGWEPGAVVETVVDKPIKLYFSKSTGELYFISQEVGSYDDGSVLYYYGSFPYNATPILLNYENIRIAKADFTNLASTEAMIEGLDIKLSELPEPVTFSYGLFYLRFSDSSARAVSLDIPKFPWIMKKL